MSMTPESAIVCVKMMFAFWANAHGLNVAEMEEAKDLAVDALRAYQPAHIDREEWTAEWVSNGNRFVCSRCGVRCAKESDETDYYPLLSAFCPSCGRAMTPDAWAELEKRMGVSW